MKNLINWRDLLIVAGFDIEMDSESEFNFNDEKIENIKHLKKLLQVGNIRNSWGNPFSDSYRQYYRELSILHIESEPISLEKWIEILTEVGYSGMENGPYKYLEITSVEIPMRGIVRQINRLGLRTVASCAGHLDQNRGMNRHPYLGMEKHSDLLVVQNIISQLGYRTQIVGTHQVNILENQDRLFTLGIELSKNNDLKNKQKIVVAKRESILEQLLKIPGESSNEGKVRSFLMDHLPPILDQVWTDDYGNILGKRRFGHGKTILLSAHMDIREEFPENSEIIKKNDFWTRSEGILGADDRAGIAMIINLLQQSSDSDFQGTIKVAFTVEEKIGQRGAERIDPGFYADVDFAISLDRRNGNNIVTGSSYTQYCDESYAKILEQVSKNIWKGQNDYIMTQGGTSDLRVWSQTGIPSVNISIGYEYEHTSSESLNLKQWHNTHDLVFHALHRLQFYNRRNNQINSIRKTSEKNRN